MMDVSVIIVNYNTFELTKQCVQSIYSKTRSVRFEVIIVDNASTEKSIDELKVIFPELIVISNKENEGFGRANNKGMLFGRGKYYLLINSDAYFVNEALDVAFCFAEKNLSYHVFGADIRNGDMSPQRSFFHTGPQNMAAKLGRALLSENALMYKLMQYSNRNKEATTKKEVGGLYGAYVFLRREVFEKAGGFDPDFFMYCEDTEWFRNRISKRYKTTICWDSIVVHLGGGSGKDTPVKINQVLSYYLYWYKLGYLPYICFCLITAFNALANLLILPFMRRERKFYWLTINYRLRCIPKILFDIPRFSNRFGSRKKPLRFNSI